VHSPLQAPPFWKKQFNNMTAFNGSKARATYAAMVGQMDFAVGKVVAALKDAGMYNNSVVVLSSDNGGISTMTSSGRPEGGEETGWREEREGRGGREGGREGKECCLTKTEPCLPLYP